MSTQRQSNSEYRFVHDFYEPVLEMEYDWFKASELAQRVNLSKHSISKNLSYLAGLDDSPFRKERIEGNLVYSYESEEELEEFRDQLVEERPWEEINAGLDHRYFAEEIAGEREGEKIEELDLQIKIANHILDGDKIDVDSKTRLQETGKVTEELRELEFVEVDEDRTYCFKEA